MKKLIMALAVMLVAGTAKAAIVGKLDLSPDQQAVGARDFTDGIWMAGVEKPLFLLNQTSNGSNLLYVAPEYLHGVAGNNQSAGLVIGVPFGDLGISLQQIANVFSSSQNVKLPPWMQDLGNYTSIEVGGGYNFMRQFGYLKPWFATIGARVRIPIGSGAIL